MEKKLNGGIFEGVLRTVLRVVVMLESRIKNKKRLKKKKINLLIWQCGPSFWSGFVLFFLEMLKMEDGKCFQVSHIALRVDIFFSDVSQASCIIDLICI